jgi:hypothetical protein
MNSALECLLTLTLAACHPFLLESWLEVVTKISTLPTAS